MHKCSDATQFVNEPTLVTLPETNIWRFIQTDTNMIISCNDEVVVDLRCFDLSLVMNFTHLPPTPQT